MIHVWYSAFIAEEIYQQLQRNVLPRIQAVCQGLQDEDPESLHSFSWQLHGKEIRLVLQKWMWDNLPSYLEVAEGLSKSRAQQIMRTTTVSSARVDFRERVLYSHRPDWRPSIMRFQLEGLVLPFRASTDLFSIPKPYAVCCLSKIDHH